MRAIPNSLLLVFALAACSAKAPSSTAISTTRDSSGVSIVTSSAPAMEPWTVDVSPALRIAGDSADAVVNQVRSAVTLPDGRVVVLNGHPAELRLYDREGSLVRVIGRRGKGPGEYREPDQLRRFGSDTIAVWQRYFEPQLRFDTTGRVVGERRYDRSRFDPLLGPPGLMELHTAFGRDRLIIPTKVLQPGDAQGRVPTRRGVVEYFVLDSSYRATRLGRYPGIESVHAKGRYAGAIIPALLYVFPQLAADEVRERIYLADGGVAQVDVRDLTGKVLRLIRKSSPPEKMADTVYRRMHRNWLERQTKMVGKDEAEEQFSLLPDQHTYPAVLGLIIDADGLLWWRDQFHRWSVFDQQGKWLTIVSIPLRNVYEIGRNYVLGLQVDDEGVESVEVLKLNRASH